MASPLLETVKVPGKDLNLAPLLCLRRLRYCYSLVTWLSHELYILIRNFSCLTIALRPLIKTMKSCRSVVAQSAEGPSKGPGLVQLY